MMNLVWIWNNTRNKSCPIMAVLDYHSVCKVIMKSGEKFFVKAEKVLSQ